MNLQFICVGLSALLIGGGLGCDQKGPPPLRPGQDPTSAPTGASDATAASDAANASDVANNEADPDVLAVKALARSVLTAWRAHDVRAIAALSPADAASAVGQLTPGNPRYDAMFTAAGWRAATVAGWDGVTLTPVRFAAQRALIRFADLPGGDVAVIDVHKVDGAWRFYHLMELKGATFAAFGSLTSTP